MQELILHSPNYKQCRLFKYDFLTLYIYFQDLTLNNQD